MVIVAIEIVSAAASDCLSRKQQEWHERRYGETTQTRWIRVPVPSPPPQHIVTRPVSLSERSSS